MALQQIFTSLKSSQSILVSQNRAQKDAALLAAADAINADRALILAANERDTEKARASGTRDSLIDRLRLDDARIDGIVDGIRTVAALDDPTGRVTAGHKTPDGLFIERVTVPLGVVAIIYESRPNVSADAASLAYKAGCSILLRGSSAALESNKAIVAAFKKGLSRAGGVEGCVELAQSGSRDEVDEILTARGFIDAVLPRGGHELIRRVTDNARVPVIETGEGNCHIFVDTSADIKNAVDIIDNAKTQKPGACNACETVLVHRDVAAVLMPLLAARLAGRVELRCDTASKAAIGKNPPGSLVVRDAVESDWGTEFLDFILAVKVVASADEAIEHVNRHGTRHSEAILTNDLAAANRFCDRVDAACVYVNASTRFTDGGEFGFGAELGISTQKFHARGPMGLEALTTIKYRIIGNGQIRK